MGNETRDIETVLKRYSHRGLYGIKDDATEWVVNTTIHKVKTKFGIDMQVSSPMECDVVTSWVKEHDKKFVDHIINPYDDGSVAYKPCLNGDFFIKLDPHTFVYVSAHYSAPKRSDDVSCQDIYLYLFGKHMPRYFKELKQYMSDHFINTELSLYSISGKSDGSDKSWFQSIKEPLKPRPLDTLYFDTGVKEAITAHLDSWLLNESIYNARSIAFKTGILIHGTAGTGKSSLATAIATYLNCSLINIDTASFSNLDTNEVAMMINSDDSRYVILFDEIDAIFKSRDDSNITEKEKNNVIKLLAFLDSPSSPDNVVFVATTNYYDRLDPALKRKGRFDLEVELTGIHYPTAVEMCKGFELPDEKVATILEKYDKNALINPAQLQSEILAAMTTPKKYEDSIIKKHD